MDWADLDKLAADPKVTFGSATVNYSPLSNLKENVALARDDDGERGHRRRAPSRASGISPIRSATATPSAARTS